LTYVPVFVSPEVSKGHYEGYCKTSECPSITLFFANILALWPLFHYLLWLDSTATVPSPDPSWLAYHKTNQLFADRVAQIYQPGDLILVHDYHLLLAPKMIRDALSHTVHSGEAPATPAISSEERKGMDWNGSEEKSKLGKVGQALGQMGQQVAHAISSTVAPAHSEANEVMIGMFVHTPWPSSEIFRCLPSELYQSPARQ
jgi:trehalose 6-phosphate synthase/phosphatase